MKNLFRYRRNLERRPMLFVCEEVWLFCLIWFVIGFLLGYNIPT